MWSQHVLVGCLIAATLHVAGHRLPIDTLARLQDAGGDTLMRLSNTLCWMLDRRSADHGIGGLRRALHCPHADPHAPPPLLVEVDDETWRSREWGQGEPPRAPREWVATLVERSFQLGAQRVVLDIAIEDGPADRVFAQRLAALMGQDSFPPDRLLVLVRTERRPLPDDEDAFLGELRSSPPVDAVMAGSQGRIVVAAPYFQVGSDQLLRDWELFKVVCERAANQPGSGRHRVVPSVQLVTAAHARGVATAVLAPAPSTACTPFLREGPSGLGEAERTRRRCALTQTLGQPPSSRESTGSAPCPAPQATATAAAPGLVPQYWAAVQAAFGTVQPMGPLPAQGGVGNRVVFRHSQAQVDRVPARALLPAAAVSNKDLQALLSRRTVVIGQTYAESGDFFQTPLGRMPGALVLVNAIDSMSRHGLVQPPHPGWTLAFSVVVIAFSAYAFAFWTSGRAATVANAAIVVIAGATNLFLFGHGIWLDFALPLLGIQIHHYWASARAGRISD